MAFFSNFVFGNLVVFFFFFFQDEEKRIASVMARKEEDKKKEVTKLAVLKVHCHRRLYLKSSLQSKTPLAEMTILSSCI